MKPKRWSRPASIAFSLLFIAIMCFTLLPSPIPFGGAGVASATATETFTTAGTYYWICPEGVTSVQVEVRGGGGGGATITSDGNGGAGGGGGAYSIGNVSVAAGGNYTYVVGIAGPAATAGGDSYFGNSTTVMAKGGSPGVVYVHGHGGAAASGYGTTKYSGGYGGDATGESKSGGGGEGAASTANGNNGSTANPGIGGSGAGDGGDGGNGGGSVGLPGTAPGGAGGGGYKLTGFGWVGTGGVGAVGQVKLTYADTVVITVAAATSVTSISAILNGNVTSLGGYGNITSYGFALSTSTQSNPGNVSPSLQTTYTAGNWTYSGVQYPVGTAFNSNGNVTDLTSGVCYYFRAAGYNTCGWTWSSSELTFRTIDTATLIVFNSTSVCKWRIPTGITVAEVLVVAGGGGGGSSSSGFGGAGGGGAGGLIYDDEYTFSEDEIANGVTVTIGGGGVGGTKGAGERGTSGGNTTFGTLVAVGGGGGGEGANGANKAGVAGGSGGGGGSQSGAGGDADYISPRQGYDGGAASTNPGGGGGGAGAVGTAGSGDQGGNGGVGGNYSTQFGTSVGDASYPGLFAGGGQGGIFSGSQTNSKGGGGEGGLFGGNAGNGDANTGGGGGGSYAYFGSIGTPGNGGSGVVIIKYTLLPLAVATLAATSITTTSATLNGNVTALGATAGNPDGASLLHARYPGYHYHGTLHNRTYFTYLSTSTSGDIYINYYDHDYGVYGAPVCLATGVGEDAHASPVVHVIPSGTYAGYILVAWYNSVNVKGQVIRSSSSESVSTWGSIQEIGLGYQQIVHLGNGNEALFYMGSSGSGDHPTYYTITTDGGQTWGTPVLIVDFGTDSATYPVVVSGGNTVHVAWHEWTAALGYNNVRYIYSPDNLATWRTQGNATSITLPANTSTAEMVYDTAPGAFSWVDDIQLDGSGSPVIIWVDCITATFNGIFWAHYSSGWSVHYTAQATLVYKSGDLMAFHTGAFVDPVDTTHIYIGQYVSDTASNIEEWHLSNHGANTWEIVTSITSGSTVILAEAVPVFNYDSDLKLIYTAISSWTSYTNFASTLRSYPTPMGTQGGNVTLVGFVWSTSTHANPQYLAPSVQTLYAGHYTSGAVNYGEGQAFDSGSNVTGLSSGTYYFRVAAGNVDNIWVYGDELTFDLTVDISNTPSSWSVGVVQPNTTYWANGAEPGWPLSTSDCWGNLTNNSTFAVNISASMTNMIGGTTWTIGSSPGTNVFTIKIGIAGKANVGNFTTLSNTPVAWITSMAAGNMTRWTMVFYTPTNSPQFADGTPKSGNMTFTAEAS